MSGEILFIRTLGFLCLAFALWQGGQLLFLKSKTATVRAKIITISYANLNRMPFHNSKWATVTYIVDGRYYTADRVVQVPMTAEVGQQITVRCFKDRPQKIAWFSYPRFGVSLTLALLLLLLGYLIIK